MLKLLFSFIFLFVFFLQPANMTSAVAVDISVQPDECLEIYSESELQEYIDYRPFQHAYYAYTKIEPQKKDILTLIDFSKPSSEERLFVIDLEKREILFRSYVAHGRNSGEKYATSFSNETGSYKSSLGFFVTGGTYNGSNGYSLRLNGLESGINDKAFERAIVIHAASYSNPDLIRNTGRLCRSLGCPALPKELNRPIIDAIKDGSLIYIYADSNDYFDNSTLLSEFREEI